MLSKEDYKEVVKLTPLVSIDLIIVKENKVLLGKRKNKPAQDFYFVPGGSIKKNETFKEAIKRISENELGCEIKLDEVEFLGSYEHIYPDNLEDDSFGTHYVALGVKIKNPENLNISEETFKEQHKDTIWVDINELLKSEKVHENTKNYFIENAPNKLN